LELIHFWGFGTTMGKQKIKSSKKEALRILQEYTKESTIAGLHYAFDRNQETIF
jgi:hypothetical protein